MLHTKIVATLGPSTSDPAILAQLLEAGLDVARVNMSHGSHESHRALIRGIRKAAGEAGRSVAILADLQGPKIRVGHLAEPVTLREGDTVVFAPEGEEVQGELPTTYPELASDVNPGDRVLLDDGLLELTCTKVDGRKSEFRVVNGGILKSNKGISIPAGNLTAASLTPKDHADLAVAMEEKVELVGLSFVRRGADVEELKRLTDGNVLVVAKIELARALRHIEEILEASDLVMVARGDLGVELPFEEVPLVQKRLIQMANLHGRPVITATQMLESMMQNPRPTRAEASDVANAVLDGTDAVMLSGETAAGLYPVEAVRAIARIVEEIEGSGVLESGPRYLVDPTRGRRSGATPREHAIASATVEAVRSLHAPAVLVITRSGFSARLVSSHRPPVPIYAVTTDPRTCRQLAPVWGVRPLLASESDVNYEALRDFGSRAIVAEGVGEPGDTVVVTAGFPFHEPGTTNTLRVEHL
jgi:pyruvate kinase